MEIDKISFKNNQAWIVVKGDDGTYLGTWHVVDPALVKKIREHMPVGLLFVEGESKKNGMA